MLLKSESWTFMTELNPALLFPSEGTATGGQKS